MPVCSRCGGEIEFRRIDGRIVPLHFSGGCNGYARSEVNDYAGYRRSKESTCFQTSCPECGKGVFFIRHNGGSVWIDPPLGPPWYKHGCMDRTYVPSKGIRSQVISQDVLANFKRRDGLLIGIVREAETTFSKSCSVISIEFGEDENAVLLIKNSAGFLVGHLVIYDQHGRSVSLVEDDKFTFRVLARFKPPYRQPAALEREVQCPECLQGIAAGNLQKHLKQEHFFPAMFEVESTPVKTQPAFKKFDFGRRAKPPAPLLRRVCPVASRWDEVFRQLVRYASTHDCSPPQPPMALILAGWSYSKDTEKMVRWQETVAWASENGCADLVEGIPDSDFYRVANLTTYAIGPMGGPCYRKWDTEAKFRPDDQALAVHLEALVAGWSEIAGPDLSAVTRPFKFTGRKARRLLVQVEGAAAPPWGSWFGRDTDVAKRRTFTAFRAAVNSAISPHEVDHIEFIGDGIGMN